MIIKRSMSREIFILIFFSAVVIALLFVFFTKRDLRQVQFQNLTKLDHSLTQSIGNSIKQVTGSSKPANDSSIVKSGSIVVPNNSSLGATYSIKTSGNRKHITGFKQPFGIKFDDQSNLYVADFVDQTIIKFDDKLQFQGFLTRNGWTEEYTRTDFFDKPHGVEFGDDNSIFVVDYGHGEIKKFDPSGNFLFSITQKISGPANITLAKDGTLYIGDYKSNTLVRYSQSGKFISSLNDGFDRLHIAKFDDKDNMYVVDTWNHRIVKYNDQGDLIGVIGAKESGGITNGWEKNAVKTVLSSSNGGFNAPVALEFDSKGNFYVSEVGDGGKMRIQAFSPEGKFLLSLGSFNAPYDIKIIDNYLFVAEPYRGRLLILDLPL